jgi:hypothetical protein
MINPNKIPRERMPLIVLSTLSSGFTSMWIRWFTNASYSHIMLMLWPGEFVSQGNTFSSVPIFRYLKKNSRLKFWRIKDVTKDEKQKLYDMVANDLSGSWWSKSYDHLGIIGQFLNIRKINSPTRMYCSERVSKYLRGIKGFEDLPVHPSPKDLNELFKKNERCEVYGRWAAD